MLHLIYIGRYEKTIKRFSKLPKEEFYNVATCDKAIKIIDKIREKFDIIILYEQTNTQTDIKDIESLRNRQPDKLSETQKATKDKRPTKKRREYTNIQASSLEKMF